jgi:hypothetical protein
MSVPTYIAATKKLDSVTTIPPLSLSDQTNHSLVVFFDALGNTFYGYIATFVDANNAILSAGAGLPLVDTVINSITLINTGATHTYQHYQDELASLINDDANKLSATDKVLLLNKAVTDWGKDVPLRVFKKIAGTGTGKYVLNTILAGLWKYGYSQIFGIEYPYGDEPPTILEDEDWDVYDDGTAQDGSNLQLWLIDNEPSAIEFFVVEFNIEPVLPVVGQQNFPDTNLSFSQVTTLAAAYACQRLATAYAQSIDASITVDVVNYNDKAAKYTTLAKQYFNRYNVLVFGQEEPQTNVRAAMIQKEITPRYNTDSMSQVSGGLVSSNYLFHRRKR